MAEVHRAYIIHVHAYFLILKIQFIFSNIVLAPNSTPRFGKRLYRVQVYPPFLDNLEHLQVQYWLKKTRKILHNWFKKTKPWLYNKSVLNIPARSAIVCRCFSCHMIIRLLVKTHMIIKCIGSGSMRPIQISVRLIFWPSFQSFLIFMRLHTRPPPPHLKLTN